MKATGNRLLGILWLLNLLACGVDLRMPPGKDVSCRRAADCPTGLRCNLVLGRCMDPGNVPPALTVSAVPQAIATVPIAVTVTDPESDEVTLIAELLLEGRYVPISLDRTAVASSPEGEATTLVWDAAAFFGALVRRDALRLRLTPKDAHNWGEPVVSAPFAFGNDAPVVTLTPTFPTGGHRFTRSPQLLYRVVDANAHPGSGERVAVSVAFRRAGASPETPWRAATPVEGTDPVLWLGPDEMGADLVFSWDALADADAAFTCTSFCRTAVDTDGDAVADAELVGYAVVDLRLTAVDSQDAVAEAVSVAVELGDTAPVVILNPLEYRNASQVNLPFYLFDDAAEDRAEVEAHFCSPTLNEREYRDEPARPRGCETPDNWRLADRGSGIFSGLLPVADEMIVTWASHTPPSVTHSAPQGIGDTELDDVHLRLRASGVVDGSSRVFGPWSNIRVTTVRNQTPPRVEELTATRTQRGGGASPVTLRYWLVDDESDPADVHCEYAVGSGGHWSDCSEYRHELSEGRYDLATAPSRVGGRGGMPHVFVWDPSGSAPTRESVRLRLSASDGRAAPSAPVEISLSYPAASPGVAPNEALLVYEDGPWDLAAFAGEIEPADLNHDGVVDLVVATGTSVDVVLGAADENLPAGWPWPLDTYALPGSPRDVAVADFDGDGVLDLVVAQGNGDLTVLFGEGDADSPSGTFAVGPVTSLGGSVSHVSTARFNGDAFTDVVILRRDGTCYVEVLLGDGSGSFALATSVAIAHSATGFAAMDLDADGATDVVVSLDDPSEVRVWLGQTVGGVASGELVYLGAWPGGFHPVAVVIEDLNGDGLGDLIVTNRLASATSSWVTSSVSILTARRDGDTGELAFDGPFDYVAGADIADVIVLDLNGDGILDLATSDAGGPALHILAGQGSNGRGAGTFSSWASFPLRVTPGAIAIVDYYGDGVPDIAFGANMNGQLYLLDSEAGVYAGPGAFAPPVSHSLVTEVNDLAVADIDADGMPDAVVASAMAKEIVVLRNDGEGSFNVLVVTSLADEPSAIALGHFDGDAILDLAVVSLRMGSMTVLAGVEENGVGTGMFVAGSRYDGLGIGAMAITVADLDNDGINDLVTAGNKRTIPLSSRHCIFLGNGDGGVADGTFTLVGATCNNENGAERLATGDFNDDGNVDVLAMAGRVNLLAGNGDGSFTATSISGTARDAFLSAAVSDFNADGVFDLALANSGGSTTTLQVYLGESVAGVGTGTLVLGQEEPVTFGAVDTVAGDFNGDGVVDLVVVGADRGVGLATLHYGARDWDLGSGALDPGHEIELPGQPLRVHAADVNGDAVLDLLVLSNSPPALTVLLGQMEGMRSWVSPLTAVSTPATGGAGLFGASLLPEGTADRFLAPYDAAHLSQHIARVAPDGATDFFSALRSSSGFPRGGLRPVTTAWSAKGDRRWTLVGAPVLDGCGTTGPRWRVENRFGPRLFPELPGDGARAGLDLAHADPQQQRGLIVVLPIARELRVTTPSPASLRLFLATTDWLRADDFEADPLHGCPAAADYLPETVNGARSVADGGIGVRAVVRPRVTVFEIPYDADGDLATGSGPRFVLVTGKTALDSRLLVLTDRLGTFQAFVSNP